MRRLKLIALSVLSIAMAVLFSAEIFAAVYLNVSVTGSFDYYATEIGASIFGTYSYNPEGETGSSTYLSFSGSGGSSSNNVYQISGDETNYGNITASVGSTSFTNSSDTFTMYIFIKNTGDRYIIPTIAVTASDSTHISATTSMVNFDVSSGNIDPLTTKGNSATATAFVSAVQGEIDDSHVTLFATNSSIDNLDTWCAKVTFSLQNVAGQGDISVQSSFSVRIGFMADVQYTSNDILSVYQTENQSSSAWTKYGYNATLHANATKVNENSLSNFELYLRQADSDGNANINFGTDEYINAVVYKDIDLVNVDIATGEIIGKLSDLDYDFEWYGRSVTLPSGTTLASGRTLASSETFVVDVYTYYPTIYIRRWVVGNKQWISLSDTTFVGAVEIPEYYAATFESTLFNPDKTVAHNTYGVFPRSYVYNEGVCTSGSTSYFINNYGYTTYSGATSSTTQSQMMAWATNLTKAWRDSALYNSAYTTASLAQGANYVEQIFNLLYLVKYANNDAQSKVGYGNVSSYSPYYASGVTVTTATGATITTGGSSNTYYEAEKSGGTIGVYNSSSKGTSTYDSTNGYKQSATGFNNAGMNYGFNSEYTYGNHKTGLYNVQFLTYNTGEKRVLLDGYVGSNSYTSVLCLGQANPWGNVWEWCFGQAVVSDGSALYAFVSFEDYDYAHPSTTWTFSTNSNGYSGNLASFASRSYVELGYNLPTSSNYYRYCGTSISVTDSGIDSLIGMPKAGQSTGSTSAGLCDYYYCNNTTSYVFGVLRGGSVYYSSYAGPFCFDVGDSLTSTSVVIGFRLSLK